MDVFDAILKRRSIRKYKQQDIPWDSVATCLNAARFAPVSGNIFNMRFAVVKSDSQRKALSEACNEQYWMQDAPIHIVVHTEAFKMERLYGKRGARIYTIQNAAAAIENILLAATALGLGSCWIGAFDEEKVKEICNMGGHVDIQAIITLGIADEHPEMPPKRSIEDVVHFGGFHARIEYPKTGIGEWSPYVENITERAKAAVKKGIKKTVQKAESLAKKVQKK